MGEGYGQRGVLKAGEQSWAGGNYYPLLKDSALLRLLGLNFAAASLPKQVSSPSLFSHL